MANDPVTGHHRPDNPGHAHWDGWNAALEDALHHTGWPAGAYDNVQVEFLANVKVENPGIIVEYVVTLTPGG